MKLNSANHQPGFSDLLQFAYLVEDGIVLNKDGALLTTIQFQGKDLSFGTTNELDQRTTIFNRMLNFLTDGWMLHIDNIRIPSIDYPTTAYFPCPVARLIDDERRVHYEKEGSHFENIQFLTFVWKFPLPVVRLKQQWFVSGLPEQEEKNIKQYIEYFKTTVTRCIDLLNTHFELKQLNSVDILTFLNTCISGQLLPITLPDGDCSIDILLARHEVLGGYVPKVGLNHLYAISLLGYLYHETVPGLLDHLTTYSCPYRWSNRFIVLSEETAYREIKRYSRHWHNQVKGIKGMIKEAFLDQPSNHLNQAAALLAEQADAAGTMNASQLTRFGYWSSTIVLLDEDVSKLEESYGVFRQWIERAGFACKREDINALEAWLGSIPGHGFYNIRRQIISGLNLAHVIPLNSVWVGSPTSSNASLLPHGSPPVFYAATTGLTPFRFHLDVDDVGHQLILGPTGAGKSTWLDLLIAQFLRYQNAQIFVFDKDKSHLAFTLALGGQHYDIGNSQTLAFCPLAELDTDNKLSRAGQWIELLLELQGVVVTANNRQLIHEALQLLSTSNPEHRNLSIFTGLIQDQTIRQALRYYTQSGQNHLLDATENRLQDGYLHTFEMGEILNQKPIVYLPVLHFLFNFIENKLESQNGSAPTLIILEEAWLYLQHDYFAQKLRDWLKTLRKKNARVIFATQSLADLYDPTTKSLTPLTATLLESCPTKNYLPNPSIDSELKILYQNLGLTERQIDLISQIAQPKRHYYVVTPQGQRLIELGLEHTPLARTFLGLSKANSKRLQTHIENNPKDWLPLWVEEQQLQFPMRGEEHVLCDA